jgi:uncharacterized protein YxjI
MTVMIMPKNKFQFPSYSFEVKQDSQQKTFNVSGSYFEFLLYTMPDTFQSGSYQVSAFIEP